MSSFLYYCPSIPPSIKSWGWIILKHKLTKNTVASWIKFKALSTPGDSITWLLLVWTCPHPHPELTLRRPDLWHYFTCWANLTVLHVLFNILTVHPPPSPYTAFKTESNLPLWIVQPTHFSPNRPYGFQSLCCEGLECLYQFSSHFQAYHIQDYFKS